MAEAKFNVYEWKIENFSCWCEAVLGKCIKSPDVFSWGKVELYPMGKCGLGYFNMEVFFCDLERNLIGDLAFVFSDGSSTGLRQLEIKKSGDRVRGPSLDLKFQDAVARIRRQRDEITLRFRFPSDGNYKQRTCTTVNVTKVSFKIDRKSVESLEFRLPKNIFHFQYSSIQSKSLWVNLLQEDEKLLLIVGPSFTLVSEGKEGKAFLVESSLSMISSDNDLVRKEEGKHVFRNELSWTISESVTVEEFKEKGISILLSLKVVDGIVIERYNYEIRDKDVSLVPNSSSSDSVTVLTNDLMGLYKDQDFSDLVLQCDNETFPVHKGILSARSPVFKTMLSTDMTEAASGQVVVDDLDPSTLSLFLTYLYTGTVEDLEYDRARKLYYAADKYQVLSLKWKCIDFLRDRMSVENVCDVLTLADRHKDECLTAACRDFVLNGYNDVLRSKNWEDFMESEPMLALKTVMYFAKENLVMKTPVTNTTMPRSFD